MWPWQNRVQKGRRKQASEVQRWTEKDVKAKARVAVTPFLIQSQAARESSRVSAKKREASSASGDLDLDRKACGTPSSNWAAPVSTVCFSQPHFSTGLPEPAHTSEQEQLCTYIFSDRFCIILEKHDTRFRFNILKWFNNRTRPSHRWG